MKLSTLFYLALSSIALADTTKHISTTTLATTTPSITSASSMSTHNSTVSHNSTSTSYTFHAAVPTGVNPNIYIPTDKNGTVFIAFGSAMGFLIIVLILARIVQRYFANRAAAKNNQLMNSSDEFSYSPAVFPAHQLKHKQSRTSLYTFGSSGSTLNMLNGSSQSVVSSGGGRQLRNALMKGNNSRNSLFVSPTEMLQLNRPAPGSYLDSPTTFIDSPQTVYSPHSSSGGSSEKRTTRPPSVYLDQLVDSPDSPPAPDSFSISSSGSSLDLQEVEKVLFD